VAGFFNQASLCWRLSARLRASSLPILSFANTHVIKLFCRCEANNLSRGARKPPWTETAAVSYRCNPGFYSFAIIRRTYACAAHRKSGRSFPGRLAQRNQKILPEASPGWHGEAACVEHSQIYPCVGPINGNDNFNILRPSRSRQSKSAIGH